MKRYFRYLQKQPHYVQRVHAGFFAGIITLIVAGIWLYYEYGFWNDRYVIEDGNTEVVEVKNDVNESPFSILKNIYNESVNRVKLINISPKSLLESSATINLEDK